MWKSGASNTGRARVNCFHSLVVVCFVPLFGCAEGRDVKKEPKFKEPATPKETKPAFTHSPLDLDAIRAITPLGNLNPRGGHIFPTDHIYFDYAPAKNVT